jgi:hypothetical protein
MQIVQLGNGKTALLRDASQISERQRRPITESITPGQDPTMAEMNKLLDKLIVAFVESWDLEVPFSEDALLDLNTGQYDALRKAVMPHMDAIMPDFGVTRDMETPTVPSSV